VGELEDGRKKERKKEGEREEDTKYVEGSGKV
jgi:hypothetical protein